MDNIIIAIHALLFLVIAGYAAWLDGHPSYAPDWTWITVAGGNALIIGALTLLAWLTPFVPWSVIVLDVTLNVTAGIPIIYWQRQQAKQRAAERAAARGRKR